MKKLFMFILFFVISYKTYSADDFWKKVDGPYGGHVIDYKENANGDCFILLNKGGIYRKINGSNQWLPSNTGILDSYFNDISIASNGYLYVSSINKIYYSTNNGDNWYSLDINSNELHWIDKLSINNDILFAIMDYSLFKSINFGLDWEKVDLTGDLNNLFCFGEEIIADCSDGINISKDNGLNWSEIMVLPDNLELLDIESSKDGYIHILNYKNDDDYLKAVILTSSNDGISWDTNTCNIADPFCLAVNSKNEFYMLTIWAVFKSNDHGKTWNNIGEVPFSQYHFIDKKFPELIIDRDDNVLARYVTGFYQFNEQNKDWIKVDDDISSMDIKQIVTNKKGEIYIETEEQWYKTNDKGENWEIFYAPLFNSLSSIITITFDHVDNLVAAVNDGDSIGIYTWNYGVWTKLTNDYVSGFGEFETDKNGNLYYGGNYLYVSSNYGKNWTKKSHIATNKFYSKNLLEVHPNGYLFACGRETDLNRSTDGGITWEKVNINTDEKGVNALEIDKYGNIYTFLGNSGPWISRDNGNTWIDKKSAFSDSPIIHLFYEEPSSGNIYAGGFYHGLYSSTDNGDTWETFNSGINFENVVYCMGKTSNKYLLAGTQDGLYISNEPITHIVYNANESDDISVFPNPVTNFVNIELKNINSNEINISINDMLGKNVKSWNVTNTNYGNFNKTLDLSGLSAGVYILRIKYGTILKSIKILKN